MLKAIRESFQAARDNAPSVLFLDEIDSFGSRTGTRTTQNANYEEKVIAGLLEQLDGVGGREGVVVIGACNHPERIDPAIRRAGRFDELVHIRLPDATSLETILRQHLGDDLPEADLAALGELALGHTGADCAAAVRNARAAARRERRSLTEADLRRALAPDHHALPAEMRRRAAIHEAGHAVVMTALDVAAVKALRIGPGGGETLAQWHQTDLILQEVQRHSAVHLSGRAAELLIFGDFCGGAGGEPGSDLAMATRLQLGADLTFGLGGFGHLSIADDPDPDLILDLAAQDRALLQRRLDAALRLATGVPQDHRPLLDDLAAELDAHGFIGEADLRQRLEGLRGCSRGSNDPAWLPLHAPSFGDAEPSCQA